jgi:phosphatidylglycerol---prolipoprotein diacylglyceryl transferase
VIPYIQQPVLHLGPLSIHAFGVLVVAGVLVGLAIFRRRAARAGLDLDLGSRLAAWVLVGGLLGALVVDRLLYGPGETLADPLSLLAGWGGISSYGGILGGVAGAWLFFWRNPQGPDTWRHLDAAAYAFPVGLLLGRIGCFLAFDHVGAPTDFFLGQTYLDGVVRHNMGLEEALYLIVVSAAMIAVGRTPRRPGFLVGFLAVAYAPGRFLLDFLRVSDERHGGLIVSQYASIALMAAGLWILWRVGQTRRPFKRETHAQET